MEIVRHGIGYDIHRLAPKLPLWICGIEIPDAPVGAVAHSDGDVALHALCDAILGGLGLPDIGHYFPDTDQAFAGASSVDLARRVVEIARDRGGRITNVDVTVVLERPKIGYLREEMRAVVADTLGVDPDRVGIKATTNEGLGPVGIGDGIAAFASATLTQVVADPDA